MHTGLHIPLSKVIYMLTSLFSSLEQFLRAMWETVSWAIVLSRVSESNWNSLLLRRVFFISVDNRTRGTIRCSTLGASSWELTPSPGQGIADPETQRDELKLKAAVAIGEDGCQSSNLSGCLQGLPLAKCHLLSLPREAASRWLKTPVVTRKNKCDSTLDLFL